MRKVGLRGPVDGDGDAGAGGGAALGGLRLGGDGVDAVREVIPLARWQVGAAAAVGGAVGRRRVGEGADVLAVAGDSESSPVVGMLVGFLFYFS